MQLSKTQISALLAEVASQEDGFNELLRMSFEALMKAERHEHLIQSTEDKGVRQVRAYGRGNECFCPGLTVHFHRISLSTLRRIMQFGLGDERPGKSKINCIDYEGF